MNNQTKGTWEKKYRYANIWHFRCSECHITCPQGSKEEPTYEFCPHCAKPMQLGSEVGNAERV